MVEDVDALVAEANAGHGLLQGAWRHAGLGGRRSATSVRARVSPPTFPAATFVLPSLGRSAGTSTVPEFQPLPCRATLPGVEGGWFWCCCMAAGAGEGGGGMERAVGDAGARGCELLLTRPAGPCWDSRVGMAPRGGVAVRGGGACMSGTAPAALLLLVVKSRDCRNESRAAT